MRWDRSSTRSTTPQKKKSSPAPTFIHDLPVARRSFSSTAGSNFTTSPTATSPIQFRISVSPSSGIETPIEDQVKCIFRRNLVLTPCVGNSRSYLGFTIPVLEERKTLDGCGIGREGGKGGSKLATAVMASGLALLGNRPASRHLMPKAMKCYSRALKEINEALLVEKDAVGDDTLAAVIVLGLFEVSSYSILLSGKWTGLVSKGFCY